ncbi:hypothetical protein EVAR_46716_1 [Eumeta japonica]|uniref:Uncharacterized protein n=1 Tax=Eumeta variegata TaxID=151549 RepID=A0A4C1X9L9_EUMVA|nr:hypothetical protein EVAR_46716_1 [Eumeta japonica]
MLDEAQSRAVSRDGRVRRDRATSASAVSRIQLSIFRISFTTYRVTVTPTRPAVKTSATAARGAGGLRRRSKSRGRSGVRFKALEKGPTRPPLGLRSFTQSTAPPDSRPRPVPPACRSRSQNDPCVLCRNTPIRKPSPKSRGEQINLIREK